MSVCVCCSVCIVVYGCVVFGFYIVLSVTGSGCTSWFAYFVRLTKKNKQNSIQTGYRIPYNRLQNSILCIQKQQIWWVYISSFQIQLVWSLFFFSFATIFVFGSVKIITQKEIIIKSLLKFSNYSWKWEIQWSYLWKCYWCILI